MKLTHLKKLMLPAILLLTVLPSNAMHAQGAARAAEVFRKGMRVVHWGLLYSYPIVKVLKASYQNYMPDRDKEKLPKSDDVEQFVHITLKEQGYPANFVNSIIVRGNYNFGAWKNVMFLPIDSHLLEEARCKKDNIPYSVPAIKPKTTIHKDHVKTVIYTARKNYEKRWGPIDHTTIDLWKGIMCHEAAHIQNKSIVV